MNTSIYVELGNGNSFIFDMGEGAVTNYLASGIPINKLNDIFLTHLHVDHFGSIPWVYAFGAWAGLPSVCGPAAEPIKKKWGPFIPVCPFGNKQQALGGSRSNGCQPGFSC